MAKKKKTGPPPKPKATDKPKPGRPFKYPWWDWFSEENKAAGGFTLVQGHDFDSELETMARLMRKRTKQHKWKAVVNVDGNCVVVELYA